MAASWTENKSLPPFRQIEDQRGWESWPVSIHHEWRYIGVGFSPFHSPTLWMLNADDIYIVSSVNFNCFSLLTCHSFLSRAFALYVRIHRIGFALFRLASLHACFTHPNYVNLSDGIINYLEFNWALIATLLLQFSIQTVVVCISPPCQ